jgi:hypothetical protein
VQQGHPKDSASQEGTRERPIWLDDEQSKPSKHPKDEPRMGVAQLDNRKRDATSGYIQFSPNLLNVFQ